MKPTDELTANEARVEVQRLRAILAGNEHLAPRRVPELELEIRATRIQLLLTQTSTVLGAMTLVAGIWLAIAVHSAWLLLAIVALIGTGVAGPAAYRLSAKLAERRQDLDGWRESLTRVEASKVADTQRELDVYRVQASDVVDDLRHKANHNRRMHNRLQILIIVGSIAITSLTSIGTDEPVLRWTSVLVAASVSIAAGVSSFFKYRERSQNQQRTADAIEKELHHLRLGVGAYSGKRADALKLFATTVERLREDQRKAELQLDQTSVPDSSRGGPTSQT